MPLIGPFSDLPSLYLKPFTGSPVQYDLPVEGLTPAGRAKVWLVGVPPFARRVSVAPCPTGSPTRVFALVFSLALTETLRLSGVLGFLTDRRLPRIV
jgi:hypothetical protein